MSSEIPDKPQYTNFADQAKFSPESVAKLNQVQTKQHGIDSPEKHAQVIQILREPLFGLADLLQDKETLYPQELAQLWSGDNLSLLENFPAAGTNEEKQDYLNQQINLKSLIAQTKIILEKQNTIKAAEKLDGADNPDNILNHDLASINDSENDELLESTEERNERLSGFVHLYFSDICPAKYKDSATKTCTQYEDELRVAFDDDTVMLKPTDSQNASLREKIMTVTVQIAKNDEEIATKTNIRDSEAKRENKIDTDTEDCDTNTVEKENKNHNLENYIESKEDKKDLINHDLNLLQNLSIQGNNLQALQNLLDSGQLKSPEIIGKVAKVLSQLQSVRQMGSTPEAQNFFQKAVAEQPVNFAASSPSKMYASLLSRIDSGLVSGEITQNDADAARVTLGVSPSPSTREPYKVPSDASQMARELRNRRNEEKQVPKIDPKTGEPMRDSEGNVIYETIIEENNDIIPIDHPNLEVYLKPDPGSDAYYVHVINGSRLPLVERIDANNFAMGGMSEINYLLATADLEQQGYTDIFGSQFATNETRRHNCYNFMQATGMRTDMGSLWTSEHSARIRQMMQMLHPRSDLGHDDVDTQNWREYASEMGIFNLAQNEWDYDALTLWRRSKVFNSQGKNGEALKKSGKIDFQSTGKKAA